MCNLTWQKPRWDSLTYQKHVKSNLKSWERSLTTALTGEDGEAAQYDPTIARSAVEAMEMRALKDGVLVQDRCHKRTYYLKIDDIIGASAGEQTQFIFVEHLCSGPVHGRPMTWPEIERKIKRAKKNDSC
jgi:hypothetical protein